MFTRAWSEFVISESIQERGGHLKINSNASYRLRVGAKAENDISIVEIVTATEIVVGILWRNIEIILEHGQGRAQVNSGKHLLPKDLMRDAQCLLNFCWGFLRDICMSWWLCWLMYVSLFSKVLTFSRMNCLRVPEGHDLAEEKPSRKSTYPLWTAGRD